MAGLHRRLDAGLVLPQLAHRDVDAASQAVDGERELVDLVATVPGDAAHAEVGRLPQRNLVARFREALDRTDDGESHEQHRDQEGGYDDGELAAADGHETEPPERSSGQGHADDTGHVAGPESEAAGGAVAHLDV